MAGAKFDLASPAEVDAIVRRNLAKMRAELGRPPAVPLVDRKEASAVVNAAGVAYLDLGAPPAGFYWRILAWMVSGQDAATTVAGNVFVYFTSPFDPNAGGSPPPYDLVDLTNTIPDIGDWSGNQRIIKPGSRHVIARVTGAPVGATIFATVNVELHILDDNPARNGQGDAPPDHGRAGFK